MWVYLVCVRGARHGRGVQLFDWCVCYDPFCRILRQIEAGYVLIPSQPIGNGYTVS